MLPDVVTDIYKREPKLHSVDNLFRDYDDELYPMVKNFGTEENPCYFVNDAFSKGMVELLGGKLSRNDFYENFHNGTVLLRKKPDKISEVLSGVSTDMVYEVLDIAGKDGKTLQETDGKVSILRFLEYLQMHPLRQYKPA